MIEFLTILLVCANVSAGTFMFIYNKTLLKMRDEYKNEFASVMEAKRAELTHLESLKEDLQNKFSQSEKVFKRDLKVLEERCLNLEMKITQRR